MGGGGVVSLNAQTETLPVVYVVRCKIVNVTRAVVTAKIGLHAFEAYGEIKRPLSLIAYLISGSTY